MIGRVIIFEIKVDNNTVSEEPVLLTPDGVLTYNGILDLAPDFTDKVSSSLHTS